VLLSANRKRFRTSLQGRGAVCLAVLLAFLLAGGTVFVQDAAALSKKAKAKTKRHRLIRPAPRALVLRSFSALVVDQQTGETFVEKNAGNVLPIASITKLMTAMVVLDAQLDLKETIVVTSDDIDLDHHSRSRLPVGTRLLRQDALLLALMASENRAAHALGRNYPGGLEVFVAAMNAKALSLGLTGTHFKDPTGLSEANLSSAKDLVKMSNSAYDYSLIREYTTCGQATLQSGRRAVTFRNTNRLIQNARWQIGLSKTGYTDQAGRCLVLQAQVARRPMLIVLLDSQGKMTRFADANRIKQWLERVNLAGKHPERVKSQI